MPQFDLRGIHVAKYVNTEGEISYSERMKLGDAMAVNLELRIAEGRLYAESSLAEYMRKVVGGTISIGVKYINTAAQKLLFGNKEKTRTISVPATDGAGTQTKSVISLVTGGKSQSQYVGVSFYAPDQIDGTTKYTAVLIRRALFGEPSMSLQTANENIVFSTPTTNGEFLADNSEGLDMKEVAILDTEEEAIAWCEAVLV